MTKKTIRQYLGQIAVKVDESDLLDLTIRKTSSFKGYVKFKTTDGREIRFMTATGKLVEQMDGDKEDNRGRTPKSDLGLTKKVTFNLTPECRERIERIHSRHNLTKNDIIEKSVSMFETSLASDSSERRP